MSSWERNNFLRCFNQPDQHPIAIAMTRAWRSCLRGSASSTRSISSIAQSTFSLAMRSKRWVAPRALQGTYLRVRKIAMRTRCSSLRTWTRSSSQRIQRLWASKLFSCASWTMSMVALAAAWAMQATQRSSMEPIRLQLSQTEALDIAVVTMSSTQIRASNLSIPFTRIRRTLKTTKFSSTLAPINLKSQRTNFTWTSLWSTPSCSLKSSQERLVRGARPLKSLRMSQVKSQGQACFWRALRIQLIQVFHAKVILMASVNLKL